MPHAFRIVDVFAEGPYRGNPLAVVLDAGDLPRDEMQRIALEMNYSETTFVTGAERSGAWPVRIFTPAEELPFAGHPTLGTAWVLRHERGAGPDGLSLDLGVGRVPVTFEAGAEGELAWLTAPPVELGARFPAERMAGLLGLAPGDVDERAPVQAASAGLSAVIVPLTGLAALRRLRLETSGVRELERAGLPRFVYAFSTETHREGDDVCARFLFEAGGVREDPATGSATALFGAWLLEHAYLGRGDLALRIEQGDEVARPSLLHLRAREARGGRQIRVGGRVFATARGELL